MSSNFATIVDIILKREKNMDTFSNRLKELRLEKGLSQEDLAKSIKSLSRQAISSWEKGERDIKLSYAIMLAKFFDVSLDYLAGLSDEYKK